jgi:hypothetical protein
MVEGHRREREKNTIMQAGASAADGADPRSAGSRVVWALADVQAGGGHRLARPRRRARSLRTGPSRLSWDRLESGKFL